MNLLCLPASCRAVPPGARCVVWIYCLLREPPVTLPPPSNSLTATTATQSGDAAMETGPLVPPVSPPPPAPPPSPVTFPLDWLLAHAAAPIQYRSLTEIARMTTEDAQQVSALPFTHRPALLLATQQSADGTWGGGMLGIPSARAEHRNRISTLVS